MDGSYIVDPYIHLKMSSDVFYCVFLDVFLSAIVQEAIIPIKDNRRFLKIILELRI